MSATAGGAGDHSDSGNRGAGHHHSDGRAHDAGHSIGAVAPWQGATPALGASGGRARDLSGDRAAIWRRVRRVLAVRLDNLGDVLMTTPALAALRDGLPAAHITLLASPGSMALAPHLPMVDRVWPFAAPWMPARAAAAPVDGIDATEAAAGADRGAAAARAASAASAANAASAVDGAEAALVERLRSAGFDAAVIFTVCTQSALPAALLCRLAGIPLRLAISRENPYSLLTDWLPETDHIASPSSTAAGHDVQRHAAPQHEVQRQLALVGSVGLRTADERLRFALHAKDQRRIAARLAAAGIAPDAPVAVLHPGATAASRRWPADRFGAVGRLLAARAGCAVVLAGDAGDAGWVQQVARAMHDGTCDGGGDASQAGDGITGGGAGDASDPSDADDRASFDAGDAGGSNHPNFLKAGDLNDLQSFDALDAGGDCGAGGAKNAVGGVGAVDAVDVVTAPPTLSLAGALSLGELAALIARARLVVCNNSLAAHLAAALGTPVVALYALTNPQHTPWRVPARVLSHDVPCRWCLKSSCPQLHHHCLQRVTAAQAANAALSLLRATAPATRAAPTPLLETTP